MKPKSGLRRFVKAECANISREVVCIFDRPCDVLEGKRCGYFEKAVLGPPDYKFRLPGYDYGKIFEEYSRINDRYLSKLVKVRVRQCSCGEILKPRKRYCEKCQIKQRRQSYRKSQEMKGQTSTVNANC